MRTIAVCSLLVLGCGPAFTTADLYVPDANPPDTNPPREEAGQFSDAGMVAFDAQAIDGGHTDPPNHDAAIDSPKYPDAGPGAQEAGNFVDASSDAKAEALAPVGAEPMPEAAPEATPETSAPVVEASVPDGPVCAELGVVCESPAQAYGPGMVGDCCTGYCAAGVAHVCKCLAAGSPVYCARNADCCSLRCDAGVCE